jgi:hypothetical protein
MMKFLKPLMRTHFPLGAKYSRRRTGNKTLSCRATATTPSLLRLKVRRGGGWRALAAARGQPRPAGDQGFAGSGEAAELGSVPGQRLL